MPASNQYSPTAEQPYQAPQMPEVVPPSPSPVPPQNSAPPFGSQASGNISHVGAAAGIADNILKGYMQGRAQRDAQQAMTLKRQTDMMQASYNSAASNLLQMHRDGADPNSPEYKQAKDAVDGSFTAMNAFYAQHVLGGDQKPKKGKGKQSDQQPTIGEMVQSKDPSMQARGWLLLQQKAGPPVYHQIQSSSTPQAQQARKTEQTMAEAQGYAAQNQLTQQKDTARRDALISKPEGQRTKAENDELTALTEKMTPIAKPTPEKPGDEAKRAADEVFKRMENPNYTVTDRDKMILYAAKMPVTADSKITVTSRGEIISEAKDGSSYKVLRGPQREYETRSELGGEGKPRRGTPTQFSQVEKDTHTSYQKAKDKYNAAINYIDDQSSNPKTKDAWTQVRIAAERKKAADALEEENKGIAVNNSVRTRDLGGIPSEGEQHPAAAAHQPESTHGQDTSSNLVTQSYQGKTVPGMVSQGNIDITDRPNVKNKDGSHSSTFSMSSEYDGVEVLYPGVGDGVTYPRRQLTDEEGRKQYEKTKKSFGSFKDAASATAYGHKLHEDQEKYGNKPKSKGIVRKAAFLHENPGATEADWNTMKVQLKTQGYEIKE